MRHEIPGLQRNHHAHRDKLGFSLSNIGNMPVTSFMFEDSEPLPN